MRTIEAVLTVIFAIALLLFVAGRRTEASGQSLDFKGSFSGTAVNVPFDLDADSCTTIRGATICTDLSAFATVAGKQSGGIEAGEPYVSPAALSCIDITARGRSDFSIGFFNQKERKQESHRCPPSSIKLG